MMQIVFVVMAIALASLLTLSGISYIDTGLGNRLAVSRGLQGQMDIMSTALASYRAANGGLFPPPGLPDEGLDSRLSGYIPNGVLPPLPPGSRGFIWTTVAMPGLEHEALCVKWPSGKGIDGDLGEGIVAFARTQAERRPVGGVLLGTDCGSGTSSPSDMTPGAFAPGVSAAVTFPQG